MKMIHDLKTWPVFFESVATCEKTFEIRKGDRCYNVGDTLFLREFDPEKQNYTGRQVLRVVTYICDLSAFAPGYVGMSIEPPNAGKPQFSCIREENDRKWQPNSHR